MSKLRRKLQRILKNPYIIISKIIENKAKFLPDAIYLDIFYRASFGKTFDWKSPQTFNQKLQWLKLHDRNPAYKRLVDKYEVRQIVSSTIGEEYLIPLLGLWDNFDDINFSDLPDQFVLKCTHDSGGVIICKNKSEFDFNSARKKINKLLKKDYFWFKREWPYKGIKPRIIAEELLVDETEQSLKDYKLFSFDGEPKMLFVASDRDKKGSDVKFDYFDMNFQKLSFRQMAHENSGYRIDKPENFDEMVNITKKLAEGYPHVRIDLYDINGRIYFGEYTFYHHSGLVPFDPVKYDYIFGAMITLDSVKMRNY
ncbi:ATP-grasp fold amidoligase family protein [Carnobacterium pleistocenium]|uniref:ATP-grasp fold amidoligase family protein n=1 Tax=Carnobacterium pleistocenium TaxID=181073 RepID=UPI000A7A2620|nr:ATP-grasp fold amidoligase family protein [Carnobacterium pleistocenium]